MGHDRVDQCRQLPCEPLARPAAWLGVWIAEIERPDGSLGESPGTGTALFAMGWTAMAALRRSNLGLLMEPKDALT